MIPRRSTLDYSLRLKDAGLVATSAAATVDGEAAILDLGTGFVSATVFIDATAVEVASGDERYQITAQFSNSATFASGVVEGPSLALGDAATLSGDTDNGAGYYQLRVTNNVGGTAYQYMRLYTVVAGTIATGINYRADLSLDA